MNCIASVNATLAASGRSRCVHGSARIKPLRPSDHGGVIGDRWGVTDAEVARSYPCDDLVESVTLAAWRGVTVEAPAGAVWRWVTQVRLAPYSYDWIDNRGRRSPRELIDLPAPVAGEAFTASGGRKLGRILAVDPERQLTATIMGAYLSYVLVPESPRVTRLLLKVVARAPRWTAAALSVGDLVMARRQLLNLKRLAERGAYLPAPDTD
jgi:hypothetical protein